MSNAVIRAYFDQRLKTWADAQNPKIKIANEQQGFTKPTDSSTWLESFLIPNTTMNRELSGTRKTMLGFFQVNCWAPSGRGMGVVDALAQNIVNLFPLVPKSGAVSIEGTPSADRPIESEPGWVIVPVLISYRYEAT